MGLPLYIALAASTLLIALLCLRDPKRRRAMGASPPSTGAGPRLPLAIGALLPGLFLILLGDAAAFLSWLGGCSVAGWLLTTALSSARSGSKEGI
ncbi:hypothetical protein [Novosphingobium sp. M1R2S20]|uniref:Uncharacterized protein n=1 Tax=Novosphingobium rhizovicinum TaxID=3228928 RepID=A0ABV3RB77_9SPHN